MKPIFLLDHRFCHAKYTPKNQSEGVYRDKKILQDLLLYSFMAKHNFIDDLGMFLSLEQFWQCYTSHSLIYMSDRTKKLSILLLSRIGA